MLNLSDKKIILASYTHIIKGKYTTIGGPGLALMEYLRQRTKKTICVWQPMPISDTLSVVIESYEKGNEPKRIRLPVINWPFGRKKSISFIYLVLKIRDIFSVFYASFLLKDKFDCFIGVEALNALCGVILRKLGLVKTVIYYNLDYGIKRFSMPLLNSIFHYLDRLAVDHADFTWCLSGQMLIERGRRQIGNKDGRQLVTPIGIRFKQIKRLSLEAIERKSIVYLGVLEELQGVQLLIEAFTRIVKSIPEARLTIIGSGDFEQKLKLMVTENKLEECIKFTGIISDEEAEEILCKSAIGVAPYVDDPHSNTRFTEPTKPKTYLGCGMPVIITKVPKIALDIDSSKAGIAINYNKQELIDAIMVLLTSDALYKEARVNAIAFASKYDWENIFDNAFKASLGN